VSFDPDGPGPLQELLVVAGEFTAAGLTNQLAGMAAFDGQQWIAMDGFAFDVPPHQLHVVDGRLYAAGGFVRRHGVPARGVAEFDVEEWVWRSVGGGVNGTVVDSDVLGHEFVVTGSLTTAGNKPQIPARNIAAWNGQSWREVGVHEGSGNGGLDSPPFEIVANQDKILARAGTWSLLENGIWRVLPNPPISLSGLHVVNQKPTALYWERLAGTHYDGAYQGLRKGGGWRPKVLNKALILLPGFRSLSLQHTNLIELLHTHFACTAADSQPDPLSQHSRPIRVQINMKVH